MKQTLLVKHAVSGRMFIDSNKQPIQYTINPHGEAWVFELKIAWNKELEELLLYKEELNVFVFKEYDEQPTLKTWYYVKEGPVLYNHEQSQLTIYTQSRIEYYPHLYSHE